MSGKSNPAFDPRETYLGKEQTAPIARKLPNRGGENGQHTNKSVLTISLPFFPVRMVSDDL